MRRPKQIAVFLLMSPIATSAIGGCDRPAPHLKPYLTVANLQGPFVTMEFAQRLALLVVEEKYPREIFRAEGPAVVEDHGDLWWVTVRNGIASPMGSIIPRRFVVHIRKVNAEIEDVT